MEVVTLRQRQKKLGRDAIVQQAETLFIERGYRKTTIQDIADSSGVGAATIFRHFRSKLGLYIAIARRDINEVFAEMQLILDDPPDEVTEAVISLLCKALSFTEKPISQVKAHSRFWLLFPTGDTELDQFVMWADGEARRMIHDLLLHFQNAGQIPPEKDLPTMSEVLFHIFNANYIEWNLNHAVGLTSIEDRLAQQIPLVFDNWRNNKSK